MKKQILLINNKRVKIIFIFILIGLCLLLSISQSYAENNNSKNSQKIVILNNNKTEYSLALNLEVLEDTSQKLTILDGKKWGGIWIKLGIWRDSFWGYLTGEAGKTALRK